MIFLVRISSLYVIVLISYTGDTAVGGTSTKYCGKSPPEEIESIGDILEIEFHTNQGDSCRGFSLDYTIVTKVVSCGTRTADVQFEFSSPHYPAPLANKTSQVSPQIMQRSNNVFSPNL